MFKIDLPNGFGPVAMINFVVEEVGETGFTVGTAGLSFTPPVTGAPFNRSQVSAFTGKPVVAAAMGTVTGFKKAG